jgi:hypothetical protein
MPLIFVSYRRQDTRSATARLCEKLQRHFGADAVFHDVESIEAGADFTATIASKIRDSSIVLVIIGPRWLETSGDGRTRLDDQADYVRLEIAAALRVRRAIIPVLVEGAGMPASAMLPADIQALAVREAHEIGDRHWQDDTDSLLARLEKHVPPTGRSILEPEPTQHSPLLRSIADYPSDLAQLLAQPRRQLTSLVRRPGYVTPAVTFFVVSHLIAAWLLVQKDLVESVPGFVFSGPLVGALILVAVSVPLHAVARLLRVPSHAPRTMAMVAYVQSVFMLLLSASCALVWTGLTLAQSDIGTRMHEIAYADQPLDVRIARLSTLSRSVTGGAFLAALALATVVGVYAVGWAAAASRAFREVLPMSWTRAAAIVVTILVLVLTITALMELAVRASP